MASQLDNIFKSLNLNENNGLYLSSTGQLPDNMSQKTKDFILNNKIKPKAIFIFNSEPLILFYEDPSDKEKLFKDVWNFNQTPVIFIVENNQIEIYNGFKYLKNTKSLEKVDINLMEFKFDRIISGETFQKYSNKYFKNANRVDRNLLSNILFLRDLLKKEYSLSDNVINSLIGRIIFIRYLIDRKIKIKYYLITNEYLTNKNLCEILKSPKRTYSFFKYIKKKFNGNLFPIDCEEETNVNKDVLQNFINLLEGQDIRRGQTSLFDIYDFSIIPIEFISNIYETFIGSDSRSEKGAYYTPLFLVNYIVENTINDYLKKNTNKTNCKVFDPACGSGIFLVESLRRIIKNYQYKTEIQNFNSKKNQNVLKKLLVNNIYGIDSDTNAINVAIFSLYITLLDYIEPPDIDNFKFPLLINKNFFCVDFFDDEHSSIKILKKIKFDYILGNPPWGNLSRSNSNYINYISQKGKSGFSIGYKEISQGFLLRTSDFIVGNCAMIVTSKVLYNKNANKFRKCFLCNNKVSKVLELSSVREYIFDSTLIPPKSPAVVLFFKNSSNERLNKENIVNHISLKPNKFFKLFKLILISKYDNKNILQSYFVEHDWLWKTLVYGSILDFYFINKLKSYDTLGNLIDKSKKELIIGRGIDKGSGNYSTKPIYNINKYVDVDGNESDLKPFKVTYSDNIIKKQKFVSRIRNTEIYKAPMLLIKSGVDNKKLNIISSISLNDTVFTSSVYSVKAKNKRWIPFLQLLSGICNSDLFLYFCMCVSTSIGIERKRILEEDIKDLPISFNIDLNNIEKSIFSIIDKLSKVNNIENNLNLLLELNNKVFNIYNLNEFEKTLIDYQMIVSRPLIASKDYDSVFRKINFNEKYLEKYIFTFIDHFKEVFSPIKKGLNSIIFFREDILCVYFKVVNEYDSGNVEWKNNFDEHENYGFLLYHGITSDVYIQKDIKGYENDSFYVIKPNEFRLWHKAISYLDLNEISNSLIESGIQNIDHGKF